MKHIGLFEGIGGFSLAARWMGWDTIAWCEWNEFGQKVLKHHFPKAKGHGDITKTDFTIYRVQCDILTGGFPCQPYSMAGKRKGKDDERHLWPEMLRAIREIQPTWVVGENVLGLVNWNGGLVFDEVQADLEAQGYEVQPYVLPACAVNAPHRRDRVWFVAYNNSLFWRERREIESGKQSRNGESNELGNTKTTQNTLCIGRIHGKLKQEGAEIWEQWNIGTRGSDGIYLSEGASADTSSLGCDNRSNNRQERHIQGNFGVSSENQSEWYRRECGTGEASSIAANTNNQGLQGSKVNGGIGGSGQKPHQQPPRFIRTTWQNFPTESPICGGNDGLPSKLDGITFSKWRAESIKAAGNAIVPQVALQIFKAIEEYNNGN